MASLEDNLKKANGYLQRFRDEGVQNHIDGETVPAADGHPENGFADLVLRMGAGRTLADKKRAGEAILQVARAHFSPLLDRPHFALSLEIVEIDPDLSWKVNSIHDRLKNAP